MVQGLLPKWRQIYIDFLYDKMHGLGTYIYKDGTSYEGTEKIIKETLW